MKYKVVSDCIIYILYYIVTYETHTFSAGAKLIFSALQHVVHVINTVL
jgi:hypothetical protein